MSVSRLVGYYAYELLDLADADYVAARHLYPLGLYPQFLWQAQQCAEKYLKAAVLFQGGRLGDLRRSHDLVQLFALLLRRITRELKRQISYPRWMHSFLTALTEFGTDRYYLRESYTTGFELGELDEAVWVLRRYCRFLDLEDASVVVRDELEQQHYQELASGRPPSEPQGGKLQIILTSSLPHLAHQRAALLDGNITLPGASEPAFVHLGSRVPFWKRDSAIPEFGASPDSVIDSLCAEVFIPKPEKHDMKMHYGVTNGVPPRRATRKRQLSLTPTEDWVARGVPT